jgi:molybdopterin-guanine dinucleotide biosynthesis protein A
VIDWIEREGATVVPFDDCPDRFRNINSDVDLAATSPIGPERPPRSL